MKAIGWAWVVVAASAHSANAHPGGTDRFGCHVDHSTGLRHCHGDIGAGESVAPTFEAAVQVEKSLGLVRGDLGVALARVTVQHDGSVFYMAGLAFHFFDLGPRASLYWDAQIGLASLARVESYFAFRGAVGVYVPIARFGSGRALAFRADVFLEAIADGVPVDPAGTSIAVVMRF